MPQKRIVISGKSLNQSYNHAFYSNFCRDIVIIEDHYIGVPLCEVFHKGKVDLNLVKFETRSIVQIECHSKHTHVADSLFTAIISFNTVRDEAKKVNYNSHRIVDLAAFSAKLQENCLMYLMFLLKFKPICSC